MTHRIIATAIALLFGLSMLRGVAAQGRGGGHAGGGHSSGGHSGGGQSAGGHASAGPSRGGHGGSVHGGGGTVSGGGKVSGGSSRGPSRPPDGHTIVGTAVLRSPRPRDVFVVTPSIYAPRFFRPRFTGLGVGFGIRHLGYGYGPAYYGLGYEHPLLCETTIACDVLPAPGAVDVPAYDAAPLDPGSGSVRLEVQPAIAQIFVDGEYVGTVEDVTSGSGLSIEAGVHRVEFRAPGYETLVVDMRIAAGRRITYRGALKPPSP